MSQICVSLLTQQMGSPQRWQLPLPSVETHESIQEAVVTRGHVSASLFAFGITSSDALEQLIQDILLNTEVLGNTLGVTAASANISPHAASICRAWHESWALCHKTSSGRLQTCFGLMLRRRSSRWRHNELRSAFWANYPGELLDSNSTPGQRYWALVCDYHLKPGNRLTWTPGTQIINEKKHMELLENKGRRPFQHGTFNSNVLGRCPTD